MLYRKTIEFVAAGVVNSTNFPVPCNVTALRYDASAASVLYAALGPITVPFVDAFSACTSTYGSVAPTPPDAAAHAGVDPRTARLAATSAPQTESTPALQDFTDRIMRN